MVIHSIKYVLSEFGHIKEMISDNGPCSETSNLQNLLQAMELLAQQ